MNLHCCHETADEESTERARDIDHRLEHWGITITAQPVVAGIDVEETNRGWWDWKDFKDDLKRIVG